MCWRQIVVCLTIVTASLLPVCSRGEDGDLREAAPPSAFLAVHARHNPERDYQRLHYEAVWKTVQDTRILERVLQLIQSRVGEADAKQFIAVRDAVRTALEPVEVDKLMKTTEVLYAQKMEFPSSQQVFLARIPDGGAASLAEAVKNLMKLAEQASEGAITTESETVMGLTLVSMRLPAGVPLQPVAGAKDDLFVFSTSVELAKECLQLLGTPESVSKFDDSRYLEALKLLPPAEDSVVFFDGKALFDQLQGAGQFIDRVSNGDPNAARVSALIEALLHQLDVSDYEVTVEYTDGYQNRSSSFGRLKSEVAEKAAYEMFARQQPFENWERWVPANASGFSLWAGFSVRPLYSWMMKEIPARFPESQPQFDKFEAIQNSLDLHLDADLLQAFSGELVSLSFPGKTSSPVGKSAESVLFLRCSKPERIQELLHRAINTLQEIPQVKAQGLSLKEVTGLEGFEELSASVLGMAGVRPVIGFRDGWMIIGSHPDAVQQVFAVRSGDAQSFAESETFRQFNLEVSGTVSAISYRNIGESTRQMAQGLQQAGIMLPMLIGMAGQQGDAANRPDLSIIQDLAGLLPAAGRIIAKMDFIDKSMSYSQAGPEKGTWIRHSVTLIRPPVEPAAAEKVDSKPPVKQPPTTKKP